MAQAARQSGGAKGLALLEERDAEGTAIVVAITGDRGLAGAFNVNIVRQAFQVADELLEEGFSEVVFTAVGKKGAGTITLPRQDDRPLLPGLLGRADLRRRRAGHRAPGAAASPRARSTAS